MRVQPAGRARARGDSHAISPARPGRPGERTAPHTQSSADHRPWQTRAMPAARRAPRTAGSADLPQRAAGPPVGAALEPITPADALELWTIADLVDFRPWARSTVYLLTRQASFPAALSLRGPRGARRVWVAEEVRAWALCSPRVRSAHHSEETPRGRQRGVRPPGTPAAGDVNDVGDDVHGIDVRHTGPGSRGRRRPSRVSYPVTSPASSRGSRAPRAGCGPPRPLTRAGTGGCPATTSTDTASARPRAYAPGRRRPGASMTRNGDSPPVDCPARPRPAAISSSTTSWTRPDPSSRTHGTATRPGAPATPDRPPASSTCTCARCWVRSPSRRGSPATVYRALAPTGNEYPSLLATTTMPRTLAGNHEGNMKPDPGSQGLSVPLGLRSVADRQDRLLADGLPLANAYR
jgi:hypothetical protein